MYYNQSATLHVVSKRKANLDGLPMILKHIHSHNCLIELRIRTLRNIIIQVLLIPQRIHSPEHEFEQRLQILRARTRHEDI